MSNAIDLRASAPARVNSQKTSRALRALYEPLVIKPLNPPTILLVDDDPVFGRIMRRLVGLEGGSITVCHDLNELGAQMNKKFDVAIIDYDLGAVNGVQLANYLETHFPQMPILLVSQARTIDLADTSDLVRGFVCKALGPYAILDAAFEAHDIAGIYKGMRGKSQRKH